MKKLRIIQSRTILWIISILTICMVLIATGYFVAPILNVTKNLETDNVVDKINKLQEELDGNVSQVSNLTAEINRLNKEISDLNSLVTQKDLENKRLRKQINALNSCLDQIDAEYVGMDVAQRIARILREVGNPSLESTENP